jgi:hypothetical protein
MVYKWVVADGVALTSLVFRITIRLHCGCIYLVIFCCTDESTLLRSDPLVSLENTNGTIRIGEGKTLNITCVAYMGLSSAVIKLDWYLMTEAGMVDISSLPAHSVSNCAVTE